MRGMTRAFVAALAALAVIAPAARGAEPRLTVKPSALARSLHCVGQVAHSKRTPLMLVTGTGASGAEAYAIGKPALDVAGVPVCYVDFPHHTTADVQVSVQYLVAGLRTMARRAHRRVAVFGISQGGLLPRIALTYWPSLRAKVSDVIAAAGTQHGTTLGSRTRCRRDGCVPAGWQQLAGSHFLRALNAQPDETPGPTAWTTVRSETDEVVQPQTGSHPTSALKGAVNVDIQSICPGRQVSHIGTGVDSVTFALIEDAMAHKRPARLSRLPADVCSHPYAPGFDEAATTQLVAAAGTLTAGRDASEPTVKREPKVRAVFRP